MGAVWKPVALAALITAVVLVTTPSVVIVNVPVVAPSAIVTFAGTDAAALLLERVTSMPPTGAAALSVTVPVALLPAYSEEGLMLSPATGGTVTVSVPVPVEAASALLPANVQSMGFAPSGVPAGIV